MIKIKTLFLPSLFLFSCWAQCEEQDFRLFGDALLRYEMDDQHIQIPDRERLRLIARLGVHYQLSDSWQLTTRLRTGLKNKQNVPAITVHKFNDQPTPDSDVFIDQLYLSRSWYNKTLKIGKIPWSSWQNSDMFWDRDLNPVGLHLEQEINSDNKFAFTIAKPLDGHSDTIGTLLSGQWQYRFYWQEWSFKVAPWLVDYKAEDDARYALRDTDLDNQFIRVAASARYKKWSFGVDAGRSLESFPEQKFGEFADQKNAISWEVKYGSLKQVGEYQAWLRYLHVERFGVITEFAQNATQRFATNNISGWDMRLRYKLQEQIWIGARLSRISRLMGEREKGHRFRLEMQVRF